MGFNPFGFGFTIRRIGGLFLIFFILGGIGFYAAADESPDEKRAELEQQISDLEKEVSQIDGVIVGIRQEKRTLANEKATLENEVKKRELEIKKISLAIRKAEFEIEKKENSIDDLESKIGSARESLASSIFVLYTYDQENLLTLLLKNQRLSEFFTTISYLNRVQQNVSDLLKKFHKDKEELTIQKVGLEEFREEQQELKALEEIEKRLLAQKKKEKEDLLRLTQGKEDVFQKLLQLKKRDIATLKTQLFYLEKTGVTAEDAVKFAEIAAKRTGIRPAFLLALLEVETGRQFEDGVISVGTNLGTGNWKTDLYDCYVRLGRKKNAEAEKNAFFAITSKLNLDPDRMPVSKRPNYGCGGAMGPAQFLPTTWLRFESKVAGLTAHSPPNPWRVEDAFTAAAIFLSESGASSKTEAGELRAAKTYISGKPNCTSYICRLYSNRIISLSRDIDRIL